MRDKFSALAAALDAYLAKNEQIINQLDNHIALMERRLNNGNN